MSRREFEEINRLVFYISIKNYSWLFFCTQKLKKKSMFSDSFNFALSLEKGFVCVYRDHVVDRKLTECSWSGSWPFNGVHDFPFELEF